MSPTRTIRGSEYIPTLPRSGSAGDYIFRCQNMIKRGRGGQQSSYWEVTGGPQNLSETIASSALTGTLAIIPSSTIVTGTGTAFTTELHLGQFVLLIDTINHLSYLLVVEKITSATSFTMSRPATGLAAGMTGYRLPVLFPVDKDRGTLLRGNAVRLDKGTLFSVGDGVFRVNGSAISASLTATRAPKVSIYNSGAGTYTHFTLGLPRPAKPTVTNVAGGTKGMQPATYGVVVTAERQETIGYGNPSLVDTVTIAAGERVEIDFGVMDSTSGQNAWGVWATRYVDSLDGGLNYLNGPWFRVRCGTGPNGQVIAADLTSNKIKCEWLDAEIETNELVSFNNDAPPNAEFVQILNGVPVYISCDGPGDTSPGPFIYPAKPGNIEAAPAELAYPTSPPELIIGVVPGIGRLFLLTTNNLQVAIGTSNDLAPVIVQPFWKAGFKNPYQLVLVDGVLYGYTTAGPSRSIGDGDTQDTEKSWAAPVAEITRTWNIGHVLVAHDPLNDAICYFYSAANLASPGYWQTRVLMWGITQQEWIGDVVLSSPTQDMIVCGVATISDRLEFLCGGRLPNDTVSIGTYRFDTATGTSVPYYLIPQFSDSGEELRAKKVGNVYITGKLTSATLKVYGAAPTETVDMTILEAGTSSKASLSLADSTDVTEYAPLKFNAKNLRIHTLRLEGTWSGSGSKDRIDEIVYEAEVQGARR